MTILAVSSSIYALLCYFGKADSNEQIFAQRTESIIFLLLAVLMILIAILFR